MSRFPSPLHLVKVGRSVGQKNKNNHMKGLSASEGRVVSFAAVIRVVTQRFSPTSAGEALRDDPNNGCKED